MHPIPTLVSHALCPYVQRVAIVMAEKALPFERIDIDLAAKPQWMLDISPTGKTPMLLTGGEALFESAAICEYLDDTAAPRLHPHDPLLRARHRAWMEYASVVLNDIAGFYNAPDEAALEAKTRVLRERFALLDQTLTGGPWFAGAAFSMVDAAFGPVFRYLDVFESSAGIHLAPGSRVQAWRGALASRPSVLNAVDAGYSERLRAFLLRRGSALSALMTCPA